MVIPGAAQADSAQKRPRSSDGDASGEPKTADGWSLEPLRVRAFPWNQEVGARPREKRPCFPHGMGQKQGVWG